jgi:prepilin peptidase CpaA
VETAAWIVAMGLLTVIAYGDVRTRRIPNAFVSAITLLGLVRIAVAWDPIAAAHTFAASAVVFTAAFLLFWRGILGGGDAKLVGAMALLVGSRELLEFLFVMIMCGGVLALAILCRDWLHRWNWQLSSCGKTSGSAHSAGSVAEPVRSTVPYGVAITAAGAFTFILKPLL